MYVVIAAARERDCTVKEQQHIHQLVESLRAAYRSQLVVISVGCDKGIGEGVMIECRKQNVSFAEIRILAQGSDFPKQFFTHAHSARNWALLPLGDEFHLYVSGRATGLLDSVVEPARKKVGVQRVFIYGEL